MENTIVIIIVGLLLISIAIWVVGLLARFKRYKNKIRIVPFWKSKAGVGIKFIGLSLAFAGIIVLIAEKILRPISDDQHDWRMVSYFLMIVPFSMFTFGLGHLLGTERDSAGHFTGVNTSVTFHCPQCNVRLGSTDIPFGQGASFNCPSCGCPIKHN
jgi:predicted RNA-binding Zn-ribbon protein involved in translation (DUF1610 family)